MYGSHVSGAATIRCIVTRVGPRADKVFGGQPNFVPELPTTLITCTEHSLQLLRRSKMLHQNSSSRLANLGAQAARLAC